MCPFHFFTGLLLLCNDTLAKVRHTPDDLLKALPGDVTPEDLLSLMHFLGRRRPTLAPNTDDGNGVFHNTTTESSGLVTPVYITIPMQTSGNEEIPEVTTTMFLPKEVEVAQTAKNKITPGKTTPMLKLPQHKISRNKPTPGVNNNGSPHATTAFQHSTTILPSSVPSPDTQQHSTRLGGRNNTFPRFGTTPEITSQIHSLENGDTPTVRPNLMLITTRSTLGSEDTDEPSLLFQEITDAIQRMVGRNITSPPPRATSEITTKIHSLKYDNTQMVRPRLTPITTSLTLGSEGPEPTNEPTLLFQEMTDANPRTVGSNNEFPPLGATPEITSNGNIPTVRPRLTPITTSLTVGPSEGHEPTNEPTLLFHEMTDSNPQTADSNNAFPSFGATPQITSKINSLEGDNTPTVRSRLTPITTSLTVGSEAPDSTSNPTLSFKDITDSGPRAINDLNGSEVVSTTSVTVPRSHQDRPEIVAPSKLRFPGKEKVAKKETKNGAKKGTKKVTNNTIKDATSNKTEISTSPQNDHILTHTVVFGPLGTLMFPRASQGLLHMKTFPVWIPQKTYFLGISGPRLLPGNIILHEPVPYPRIAGSGNMGISCAFGVQCVPYSRGFNRPTHVLRIGADD